MSVMLSGQIFGLVSAWVPGLVSVLVSLVGHSNQAALYIFNQRRKDRDIMISFLNFKTSGIKLILKISILFCATVYG